jgi:hypothetical protein
MQTLISTKNTLIGTYENYIYHFAEKNNNVHRWRCKKRGVTGAVFINNEFDILRVKVHTHVPNPNEVEKIKLINVIKNKAKRTTERLIDLITEQTKDLENGVLVALHPYQQLEIRLQDSDL